MMILLLSEGKHKLGSDYATSRVASPLEILVRRILVNGEEHLLADDWQSADIQVERVPLRAPMFRGKPIRVGKGKGLGFEKLLLTWIREAKNHGFDAVVAVVDHDGDENRIEAFDAAQAHDLFPIRRAFGIAIRTFDGWMLADELALSLALGATVPTPRNPENERDSKARCQELLANSETTISLTEMYVAVATTVRIAILEKRCSRGFRPFSIRVRSLTSADAI
jgi:hypothetical protein